MENVLRCRTYPATEAILMPFLIQSLHDHVYDRFSASCTLSTEPSTVAIDTPSKAVFLNKRCIGIKRISTFCAEEVTNVPLTATGNYHFSLDRGLTRPASGAEVLVVI